MKPLFLLFVLGMFCLLSCEEEQAPLPDAQIMLDAPFVIRAPQKAQAEGMQIAVTSVADCRCRPDAQCIWEGDVSVQLLVSQAGDTEVVTLLLHRPEVDGKNTAQVGAYQLSLEWVSMPPGFHTQWALEDYELRLVLREK